MLEAIFHSLLALLFAIGVYIAAYLLVTIAVARCKKLVKRIVHGR